MLPPTCLTFLSISSRDPKTNSRRYGGLTSSSQPQQKLDKWKRVKEKPKGTTEVRNDFICRPHSGAPLFRLKEESETLHKQSKRKNF